MPKVTTLFLKPDRTSYLIPLSTGAQYFIEKHKREQL